MTFAIVVFGTAHDRAVRLSLVERWQRYGLLSPHVAAHWLQSPAEFSEANDRERMLMTDGHWVFSGSAAILADHVAVEQFIRLTFWQDAAGNHGMVLRDA